MTVAPHPAAHPPHSLASSRTPEQKRDVLATSRTGYPAAAPIPVAPPHPPPTKSPLLVPAPGSNTGPALPPPP